MRRDIVYSRHGEISVPEIYDREDIIFRYTFPAHQTSHSLPGLQAHMVIPIPVSGARFSHQQITATSILRHLMPPLRCTAPGTIISSTWRCVKLHTAFVIFSAQLTYATPPCTTHPSRNHVSIYIVYTTSTRKGPEIHLSNG